MTQGVELFQMKLFHEAIISE